MNSHVITVDIGGRGFFFGRIEFESEPICQLVLKLMRRPGVPSEEMLQARAVAIFAQGILIAKDFGDASHHRQRLLPSHERVKANRKVRVGREATSHPNGEADFALALAVSLDGGET